MRASTPRCGATCSTKSTPCMHGLGCADHPGVGLERKRAAIQRQCEESITYGQMPMGMDNQTRNLGLEMVKAWREGTGPFARTNNNTCGCNGKGE